MGSNKETSVKLIELFHKAIKAAKKVEDDERDQVEEKKCIKALKAMKNVPVSTTILIDTQVGKQLLKLTKHKNSRVSIIAQELISAWKKVVATEAVVNNKNSTSCGKNTLAETTTTTHSQANCTLMPITRDRIRELLAEAFAKVLIEAKDEDLLKAEATNVGKLTVTVENAMFTKLPYLYSSVAKRRRSESATKRRSNRSKFRSIMFNLQDPRNPDLRRRVLIGEVTTEQLLTMTTEDMASDQRKQETQNIKDEALYKCERGQKAVASTDQFKCGKCKQRKCTYFQMQTRSADEPMTTFVTCVECNNHWKF